MSESTEIYGQRAPTGWKRRNTLIGTNYYRHKGLFFTFTSNMSTPCWTGLGKGSLTSPSAAGMWRGIQSMAFQSVRHASVFVTSWQTWWKNMFWCLFWLCLVNDWCWLLRDYKWIPHYTICFWITPQEKQKKGFEEITNLIEKLLCSPEDVLELC